MPGIVERKAFTEGLGELDGTMRTLAELSELAIRKAVATLDPGPPANADGRDVRVLDREIFGLRERVVSRCVDLIALYAPVARDLRQITASLEISNELDRIGRYSQDIVEITERLGADVAAAPKASEDLAHLGTLVIAMVDRAVTALTERRADLVQDIVAQDDPIDALHDRVFREIVARIEDRTISPRIGAEFILINRYFERLADHAVNIGLQVTYVLTGVRPRPLAGRAAVGPLPAAGPP